MLPLPLRLMLVVVVFVVRLLPCRCAWVLRVEIGGMVEECDVEETVEAVVAAVVAVVVEEREC